MHEAVAFIAQQQVLPLAGIPQRHVLAPIAHLAFRVGCLYEAAFAVHQGQFPVGNRPADAATLGYGILRRQVSHAGRAFRLAIGGNPTPARVPAILGKLQVQRTWHLAASLRQQGQVRQVHPEEAHQVQDFETIGHAREAGGPLLFHEVPKHLVCHVQVGDQDRCPHVQVTEHHGQSHRVIQRQYQQRTLLGRQPEERGDVQCCCLDVPVLVAYQLGAACRAGSRQQMGQVLIQGTRLHPGAQQGIAMPFRHLLVVPLSGHVGRHAEVGWLVNVKQVLEESRFDMRVQYQRYVSGIHATDAPGYPAHIVLREQEQQGPFRQQGADLFRESQQFAILQGRPRRINGCNRFLRMLVQS